jgi:hypothetical protein
MSTASLPAVDVDTVPTVRHLLGMLALGLRTRDGILTMHTLNSLDLLMGRDWSDALVTYLIDGAICKTATDLATGAVTPTLPGHLDTDPGTFFEFEFAMLRQGLRVRDRVVAMRVLDELEAAAGGGWRITLVTHLITAAVQQVHASPPSAP